jgi:hypothetical protein
MRTLLLVVVGASLLLSAARTSAQTSAPAIPSAAISPPSGDIFTTHELQLHGVALSSDVLIVVFDPAGGQTIMHAATDASGAAQVTLAATAAGWQLGLYRAVVALGGGNSISATFTTGDGGQHLMVGPDLPSPNSAFEVTGVGLPPSSEIHLVLTVAGGLGERDVSARTDTHGTLTSLLWPQALGFDFFSAGRYELAAPDLGLDTSFFIREHPSTSSITLDEPIKPGDSIPLRLKEYTAGRYVWAVYATNTGQPAGEFLFGPIDERGESTSMVQFPTLSAGRYLLATPYDWGETTFSIAAPAPTSTPTETVAPTLTSPAPPPPTRTATPNPTRTARPAPTRTATRTATPQPRATRHKTCKRTKNHKQRCKA